MSLRITLKQFYIPEVFKGLKGEEVTDPIIHNLVRDIKSLDPDCVVVNWECSQAFSHEAFADNQITMEFIKFLLNQKHMVMFGDFSLKALIKQWDEKILGPNPFVKLGETSGHMNLYFKPEDLMECPSKQLQMVGRLTRSGEIQINTMGSTIEFGIDHEKSNNTAYKLSILTITDRKGKENKHLSKIGEKEGTCGHAILKFRNGGIMIVSAGHWVELLDVDVDVEKLRKVAKEYGGDTILLFDSTEQSQAPEAEKK